MYTNFKEKLWEDKVEKTTDSKKKTWELNLLIAISRVLYFYFTLLVLQLSVFSVCMNRMMELYRIYSSLQLSALPSAYQMNTAHFTPCSWIDLIFIDLLLKIHV